MSMYSMPRELATCLETSDFPTPGGGLDHRRLARLDELHQRSAEIRRVEGESSLR